MLFAQAIATWGILQWAIFIIVLAGIVGVVVVIVRATGVAVPAWIYTVLWICLAVLIGVVAVKFLASLL